MGGFASSRAFAICWAKGAEACGCCEHQEGACGWSRWGSWRGSGRLLWRWSASTCCRADGGGGKGDSDVEASCGLFTGGCVRWLVENVGDCGEAADGREVSALWPEGRGRDGGAAADAETVDLQEADEEDE